MQKCVEVAKRISKQLDKNCLSILEENNLHKVFYPIFLGEQPIEVLNTIVVYIIYAYDSNSQWININADRLIDKENILKGLGASKDVYPYVDIINNNHQEINEVIAEYLSLITTWKWRTIMACLDLHQQSLKTISQPITSNDALEIEKIKKERSANLREGIRNREVAENLLKEIKSEFVKTDRATQEDFCFLFTDEKLIDPLSWREFIKRKNKA